MRRRPVAGASRAAPRLPDPRAAHGGRAARDRGRHRPRGARFRMPDFFYGGQALIEGVMMRGRTTVAMSVRPPSGEIGTMSEPLPGGPDALKLIRIPFLRGMFLLYETLVIGTRMLMRSASIAAEGEDIELGKGTIVGTMVFSLGFAIGPVLPPAAVPVDLRRGATNHDILANPVEGLIRLVIFIAYIGLIGLMEDIRRVFAYHGAEHKAISANEAERPLTPEEVDASAPPTRAAARPSSSSWSSSASSSSASSRAPACRCRCCSCRASCSCRSSPPSPTSSCASARATTATRRARHLPARPVAPVADHPPAGPIDARGEHRQPRDLPGRRPRGRRGRPAKPPRAHDRPPRRAGGALRGARRQLSTPEAAERPGPARRARPRAVAARPDRGRLRAWRGLNDELAAATEMAEDPDEEMRAMAREEVAEVEAASPPSRRSCASCSSRATRTTTAT